MPSKARILYTSLPDEMRKEEKLNWLKDKRFDSIEFEKIIPDKNNNWINLGEDTNFDKFLSLCSKESKVGADGCTLFKLFSTGISTNRDEWVVDFSQENVKNKMRYFSEYYNSIHDKESVDFTRGIKWSRNLKQRFERGLKEEFSNERIIRFNYRPYSKRYLYLSDVFIDEHGLTKSIFSNTNVAFCISGLGSSKPFQFLAVNNFSSLDFLEKTQIIPLFRYDKSGARHDNITDWGLAQFTDHYKDETITKEEIFHYTYAVLHNPEYRKKYELNLKREFPRLPFYDDFRRWVGWGKWLMELHINYETVEPYDLKENTYTVKAEARRQVEIFKEAKEPDELYTHVPKIKPKLKADKAAGIIEIDELTFLSGVPQKAWEYKLGNRSALEWVLDQYKEKKPSDPTIAKKFNTYRFADYKTKVIDLLRRVCKVSVETVGIIEEMASLKSEV